ncbi:hypothetical protein BC938DRAFT_482287 [Jimgerdemannia flammicorona]|uniref:Uncharacterized protein n=1 Tax=Jimgerdemannia flammicorona TaxID=994334 RepID=A0A433QWF2_9FUNG|nr:hypothetical protein BC938DRAFT_482287 [Jimgerdemannia flammicorona]
MSSRIKRRVSSKPHYQSLHSKQSARTTLHVNCSYIYGHKCPAGLLRLKSCRGLQKFAETITRSPELIVVGNLSHTRKRSDTGVEFAESMCPPPRRAVAGPIAVRRD